MSDRLQDSFDAHRRHLWAIGYRMLGTSEDADDLVQSAYVRALERPPRGHLRPWLVRVTVNLARDELRRRKRRPYPGPWLPGPVATDLIAHEVTLPDGSSTEARYDLLESVSFAFLVALEALTPTARAVLLLRDVFDYSGRETAEALELSEANVKTTLHRARRVMESYDASRLGRGSTVDDARRDLLASFLAAVGSGDTEAVAALLADDVEARNDGGGAYHAALNVLRGAERVAKFFVGVGKKRRVATEISMVEVNGSPAVLARFDDADPRLAPRVIFALDPTSDGSRIRRLYVAMAPAKVDAFFDRAIEASA